MRLPFAAEAADELAAAAVWYERERPGYGALFLSTVVEAGDRAAVYAPNRVEWASAALAIQAAGAVLVPIYPASTAEQLSYVVAHSDTKVLFVDTPALLGRVLEAWSSLEAVLTIVTLVRLLVS